MGVGWRMQELGPGELGGGWGRLGELGEEEVGVIGRRESGGFGRRGGRRSREVGRDREVEEVGGIG